MKKGKNVFLNGLLPHRPEGLFAISKPAGPRLWGWGSCVRPRKNIFLPFFLCFCFQFLLIRPCHADTVSPQVCHQDNCLTVEVVSKDADLERGLMYRTSLGQNKGMLFIFSKDDIYQFWMKNMHFSLDMLWISLDGHIVFIGQDIPACTKDPCPVYTPNKPARYVLEINSGYAASHNWKVGDKLDLKGLPSGRQGI